MRVTAAMVSGKNDDFLIFSEYFVFHIFVHENRNLC